MTGVKEKIHNYSATIQWMGNKGVGTKDYKAYSREHTISIDRKNEISGSSDPAFRGDNTKHNPEDLFLSSISACHMLWYLHLCAQAGIVVTEYVDYATAKMKETENGSGHFTEVTLNPHVTVTETTMIEKATELHKKANEYCFVANSVNFPIYHIATTKTK